MIQKTVSVGFLLIVTLYASLTHAQANPTLQQAETAIKSGNRADALSLYQKLYTEGFESAELHYNIGTLFAQEKQLGEAVFHLQKAHRLAPFDDNIKSNLLGTRDTLTDNAFAKPVEPPLWEKLIQALPAASSQWGWLLLLFLGWVWFLWQILRQPSKTINKSGLALIILCGFAATLLLSFKKELSLRQYAVVTGNDVSGQSAPSEKAESAFTAQEGAYGEMKEAQGQYIRLRLQNGLEAWFHEKHLYFGQNDAP